MRGLPGGTPLGGRNGKQEPKAAQIERQMSRDGCDRDEALRRIDSQLPIEEKKAMADVIVDNSGDPAETERQVREIFDRLTEPG